MKRGVLVAGQVWQVEGYRRAAWWTGKGYLLWVFLAGCVVGWLSVR